MTVLVTGATGFLGQRLVRRLLLAGVSVRCLVRPSSDVGALLAGAPEEKRGAIELCHGTLNQLGWAADALRGCDVVYHVGAALTGGPAVLFLNNVTATRELMRRASEAKVGRFVLVSSLGVYGTHHLRAGDTLDERCPLDPKPHIRDPYTFSKVRQEQAAREVHEATGLPLVTIRPGVIYGPGRSCISGRLGLQLGNWLVRMGGWQRLPYTYVDNVADAVALAGTAPGVDGEAFNVVDDGLPRARTLLRMYRREVGGVRVIPVPHWGIGPLSAMCEKYHVWSRGQIPAVLSRYKSSAMWKRLRYVNEKAKARLAWAPVIGFDEGLRRTFASLRDRRVKAQVAV